MTKQKPKATTRAVSAVLSALGTSSLGTHETTVAHAFGLSREEVDATVAAMIKDKTLVRVATGVLFLSKTHFDRLDADYRASRAT